MTDQPEILELIARYLNNPDDEDFKSQVDYFRGQSVENEAFFKEIEKVWHLSGKSALFEALDHDKVVSKFQKRISATSKDISNKKAKSVFGQIFRWSAAAAIFIVIGSFAFLYKIGVIGEKKEIQYLSDALPGSNKAVLVLADGRKISLTDINNGAIAKEAGLSITKTSDGQLIYTVAKEAAGSESSLRGAFNTIETPKGGMWQVKLPDGSSVWLNAASSLTYPIAFSNGKKRIVELKGEAYFEVAKDKLHPFVVKTARQEVEVLGTSFNINSYLDEPTVKTTLLEGNVRVSADGLPAKVLVPDEQAVLSNNEISILRVIFNPSVCKLS